MDENIYYDNYMDDNDSENYDPFEDDPRYKRYYKVKKILGYTIKTFIGVVMFAVIATLFFRVYTIQEPKEASSFVFTEESLKQYQKSKFKVYSQKMVSYLQTDPTTGEQIEVVRDTFNGSDDEIASETMCVTNMHYVPELKQVQVTFRWNQNAEEKLLKDYNLEMLPNTELFRFVLSDEKDNVYSDLSYVASDRYVYEYRRLVFENVDVKSVKELYLNIYFVGAASSVPYEKLMVYDYNIKTFTVEVETPKEATKGVIKVKYED